MLGSELWGCEQKMEELNSNNLRTYANTNIVRLYSICKSTVGGGNDPRSDWPLWRRRGFYSTFFFLYSATDFQLDLSSTGSMDIHLFLLELSILNCPMWDHCPSKMIQQTGAGSLAVFSCILHYSLFFFFFPFNNMHTLLMRKAHSMMLSLAQFTEGRELFCTTLQYIVLFFCFVFSFSCNHKTISYIS